jgi:osmotically-inducible protein OsmY
MRSAIRRIAVLAIMIIAVAGCQSMTGETAGENIDDTFITTTVKAKLADEKIATLTQIGVETTLRTVHLTGLVEGEALRARAAEIARSVNGVREVVNDITIQSNR